MYRRKNIIIIGDATVFIYGTRKEGDRISSSKLALA
jgi:hypothetical protein